MEFTKVVCHLGKLLKSEEFVSPVQLQTFITNEEEPGSMVPPLPLLSAYLDILYLANFLDKHQNLYSAHYRQYGKLNVGANLEANSSVNPLWTNLL